MAKFVELTRPLLITPVDGRNVVASSCAFLRELKSQIVNSEREKESSNAGRLKPKGRRTAASPKQKTARTPVRAVFRSPSSTSSTRRSRGKTRMDGDEAEEHHALCAWSRSILRENLR